MVLCRLDRRSQALRFCRMMLLGEQVPEEESNGEERRTLSDSRPVFTHLLPRSVQRLFWW